ncbi:TrkH family potassium uptake protein [Thermanaerosceptrum fracticalcis]|uniref:TrkH family potassium uptake protein n=1 Tax=Thermanaerosceptrum fracticalcis TaxID=1712410 RepID=A0A7G6E158_THEFR|nr:TrkH family potassium uptake protein [Thermanaerosceptrum fracticalcis]QNB45812.1 TrkH family potassium uptake protein [Thermanaerosceptrum fracticalcis]
MNYQKIISSLGIMLMIIGVSMVLPLMWSLYYGDSDWLAFLGSSIVTFLAGFVAHKATKLEGTFHNREAFIVVTFSWLLASAFGAIPYILTGTFTSYADAFFETMSGFTTTGASVLTDIESLPHGVLFWRSLTHWLGGMGIVVLFIAILSSLGTGGMQMFRAESPGPVAEKIKPRISETAKILWYTYLLFTIVETLLLWLLGMPLFDALCHTFGTLATGGFSTKNASIGYYTNPMIHWVITIFMFMSGANFALYYQALRGRSLWTFWRNPEFKLYSLIVLASIAFVSFDLFLAGIKGIGNILNLASFQVVSIITTTGYATADFDRWPFFSQAILVALMFVGGCAGSTGGSIKVGRILVLLKQCLLELQKVVHPRAIMNLKIGAKNVPHDIVINILQFFFIYILITIFGTVFMALLGLDLTSAFTAVAATLGNVGPGLAKVGPVQNYSFIPATGKYMLSIFMLLGRLELYTVLVLILPSFWKK